VTTIALWKPHGTLTRFTDDAGRDTLAGWVDLRDVYPAGRLDRDSEGLLILSDDRTLRGSLTAARHDRVYLAQVEGIVEEAALDRLRSGVEIGARTTLPALAREIPEPDWMPLRDPPIRVRRTVPDSWIELTIREGKNRQVRRMTAAVGLPTLRLVRWAVGPITLEGLQPGVWRTITHPELVDLRAALA